MKSNSTFRITFQLSHYYRKIWLVLSLVLIIGASVGFKANAQSISQKERDALISFYNLLNGDSWINKTGWKSGGNFTASGTENTWFGVTLGLDGTDLVVKEINLPSNNLSGKLSDSLVNLPFLEILKLDGNQITGELNPLSSSILLKEIGLNNNKLNDTIPNWIGDLTNLEKLRLANNTLVSSIPTEIGNLANLTQLRLEGNKLRGELPTSFTSLTALTDLNLSFNALFTPNNPTRTFVNSKQATWLETQTLAPLNLTLQVISAEKISLSWDEIDYTNEAGGYLILYGKTNGIYSDSLFVPQKDSVSVVVEKLDNDSTYYFAIQSFTDSHSNNSNMVYSSNSTQVSGKTLKSILPTEREALIALYNNTDGDNWTVKTNWKNIEGEFLEPGFEHTWHGVTITNINDTLRVRQITLNNNNLVGQLPTQMGGLGKLFLLNLNNNELNGSIPSSFGNLKELTRLQLANNRLTGGLSPQLGGLTKVSILELNSNALVGEIPAEIVNISGASAFNISYNGLYTNNASVNSGLTSKPGALAWASTQTRYPLNIVVNNIKPTTATISWSPISYTANGGNYFLLIGKQAGIYTDTVALGPKNSSQFGLTNLDPGTNYHYTIQSFTPNHDNNKNAIRSSLSPNQAFSTPAILSPAERNALIAIFNSTGGSSWTTRTNWQTNPTTFNTIGTEGTWHGVTLALAGSSGFLTVTELDLSFNNLTGEIPPAIFELVNLKKLRLNGNKLTGTISPNVSALSQLEELRLDQNALIGSLTNSLQQLQNLGILNLRFNGLSTSNDPLNTFVSTLDTDWRKTQTIAPSNFIGEEISPTSTKITWTPIEYTGNDGYYILRYGTVPGVYTQSVQTNNKSISEITLSNLNPAGTYFMVMQTVTQPHQNNLNTITSQDSPEFQFFALPPPPPRVVLTAPANESINLPLNLNLRWEGQLGIQEYQLQLSRNVGFNDIIRDELIPNAANFNVDALTHNTRYFWRVRAKNAGGFGEWSNTWEFRTLLATPFTVAPSNPTCISVQPVEFSWQSIAGANRYIFQVSTASNFATLVQDRQNLQNTSITISDLPANGTYFWRVKAVNTNGDESNWSPTSRISLFTEVSITGATAFCEGVGSVTFTAPPGATSYLWYRNGTPLSGESQREFTATQAGSYFVQVGSSIGCVFLTQPITVTTFSIATPTVSFAGSSSICEGTTKELTSSIAATYQWFRNGEAIQGANQRIYISNQTGDYSVRTSTEQGCTATSASSSITVTPLPPATITFTGSTNFCQGQNLLLNASTISGGTYQWFNNNSPIAGATAPTFTVNQTGNYSVRVTNAQGCSTTSTGVGVTVTPNPGNTITASGPLTFCLGGNVTLTAPEAGSYQWQIGNQNIDGATSRTLQVSQPGSYRVIATNNSLCAVTSNPINVAVQPLPVATITMNGPVLSAPEGDFTYQWFKDENIIAGETGRTFTTFTSGSYQVRLTATTGLGCSTLSAPQQLSITSFENGRIDPSVLFTTYPNPVSDLLNVRIRKTAEMDNPTVRLYTMDGKELGSFTTAEEGDYHVAVINMSNYRSGQYLVMVRSKKSVLRKSILKH
jgi:Leucine-rich repeat (LRR) protein